MTTTIRVIDLIDADVLAIAIHAYEEVSEIHRYELMDDSYPTPSYYTFE